MELKYVCPGCKRREKISVKCPELIMSHDNTQEEIIKMEKVAKDYLEKNNVWVNHKFTINNKQLFALMKKEFGVEDTFALVFHHFVGRMIEDLFNSKGVGTLSGSRRVEIWQDVVTKQRTD
jgi:hypothetical protein